MEALDFTKDGNRYIAQFVATADFSLHIELEKAGYVSIEQCSSDNGAYVPAHTFYKNEKILNIDTDFMALVYPKRIQIISEAPVKSGSYNFSE